MRRGEPAYQVKGKLITLRNRMQVFDALGRKVAVVQKVLISLHAQEAPSRARRAAYQPANHSSSLA